MTLCIAAKARDENNKRAMVCCFDTRVETSTAGSETGFKLRRLPAGWGALIAGALPAAEELVARLASYFQQNQPEETVDYLRVPVWAYKKALVDDYLHSLYAISADQFYTPEHGHLTPSIVEQTLYDIAKLKSQCSLILFKEDRIFVVEEDFGVWEAGDFCAIGSGGSNAESWLHYREQSNTVTVANTLYVLYEAKKFAEVSPGVGRRTYLYVLTDDGMYMALAGGMRPSIIKRLRKYGPKRIADVFQTTPNQFQLIPWPKS